MQNDKDSVLFGSLSWLFGKQVTLFNCFQSQGGYESSTQLMLERSSESLQGPAMEEKRFIFLEAQRTSLKTLSGSLQSLLILSGN